jgi:hypothetical protein
MIARDTLGVIVEARAAAPAKLRVLGCVLSPPHHIPVLSIEGLNSDRPGTASLIVEKDALLDGSSTRRLIGTSRMRLVAASAYLEFRGTPKTPRGTRPARLPTVCPKLGPGRVASQRPWRAGRAWDPRSLSRKHRKSGRASGDRRFRHRLAAGATRHPGYSSRTPPPGLDEYRSDESKVCAVFSNHRHIRRVATTFMEHIQVKLMDISERIEPSPLQATVAPYVFTSYRGADIDG